MKASDIMTEDPTCCESNATIASVAQLMKDNDCGEIPVIEQGKLVGVITDRDICCRVVAEGRDPDRTVAANCMSSRVVTLPPEADIEQCISVMERNQVRRIPIVNRAGRCCGIVAQADIAAEVPQDRAGEVLKEVSRESRVAPM